MTIGATEIVDLASNAQMIDQNKFATTFSLDFIKYKASLYPCQASSIMINMTNIPGRHQAAL